MTRGNWIRRHPLLIRLLVAFSSVLLLLMMLEKVCGLANRDRLLRCAGTRRYIRLREHNPQAFQEVFPDDYFFATFAPSLTPRRFRIQIDENGFIFPSRKHADPDVKIVFLGGSTTECLLNDEKSRFPCVVGELLEQRTGRKVNSYNGGRGGNNSLHSLDVLLNKVVPMHPDFVVLMHNINDLVLLILERSYWNENPKRSPLMTVEDRSGLRDVLLEELRGWVPNLVAETELLVLRRARVRGVGDEFSQYRGKKALVDPERLLDEFRMNLETFVALCRIRRMTPVLMTQASMITKTPDDHTKRLARKFTESYGVSYEGFKAVFDSFNQTIRDFATRHQVLLVDLDREIPKDRKYIYDLIHFSDEGSELTATVIAQALLKVIEHER
jgi:hypothetical protein